MNTIQVQTERRSQMIDITGQVRQAAEALRLRDGFIHVYVPHTTAGITINENADPDVVHDMLEQLDRMVPWAQPFYRHSEGNSAAHVKASMMGSSVQVRVEAGELRLGRWQGIWFCEFDGPRVREVWLSCLVASPRE